MPERLLNAHEMITSRFKREASPFLRLSMMRGAYQRWVQPKKEVVPDIFWDISEIVCCSHDPRFETFRMVLFPAALAKEKGAPESEGDHDLIPLGFLEGTSFEEGKRNITWRPLVDDEDIGWAKEDVTSMAPDEVDLVHHWLPDHPSLEFDLADPYRRAETREYYERLHRTIVGQLKPLGINPSWNIAEPGCERRAGLATLIARETGARVYASDVSGQSLVDAYSANYDNPLVASGRLSFHHYPVQELHRQHSGVSFDMVLLAGVFNWQIMDNEKDVLDGLEAVWASTHPDSLVLMTGLGPLLVRSHELKRMGFKMIMYTLPKMLFDRPGTSPGQFYLMQRGEGNFRRPEHLDVLSEMKQVGIDERIMAKHEWIRRRDLL
ncbi:MAG: hypothetical protein NT099_04100 [Candidatus Saganbacteria bacterium]|nr:hypothetical protein [Candidatus Saganbacteria bacterium]